MCRANKTGETKYSEHLVGERCYFHLFSGDGDGYICTFIPATGEDRRQYMTYFIGREIDIEKLEKAEDVRARNENEEKHRKYLEKALNTVKEDIKEMIKKEIEQEVLNNLKLIYDPYSEKISLEYKDKYVSHVFIPIYITDEG